MKFNKKAAMFGLDARIALAIFGTLSVISGASLYAAIKASRAESIRQNFVELLKAVDEYYLNNYKNIPQEDQRHLYLGDLIVNRESLVSWNGPYIQEDYNNQRAIKTRVSKNIDLAMTNLVYLYKDSNWSTDTAFTICDLNDSDCSEYASFYSSKPSIYPKLRTIFNDLDKLVDGGDGTMAGNVRKLEVGSNAFLILYKGKRRVRRL